MFKNNIFQNYTGGDATGEILIMLLGAFALGYLLRWLQNRFWGCEHCAESELEMELKKMQAGTPDSKVVAAAAPVVTLMPKGVKKDDLKVVEGIGPKIEQLLHDGGIKTWEKLANTHKDRQVQILREAGDRFRMHDPSTWSEQAMLAHEGKWDELDEYQDFLSGGKVM